MEVTVTTQRNSTDSVCVLLCYCCEGNSRGQNLERERERELGTVTTGGYVEGTVTGQQKISDSVCVLLCYCCEGKRREQYL